MPRPIKCRRVTWMPGVTYFKPAGIPLSSLYEICLSVEEIEAIRLKDLQDMDQEQCAQQMNISRATFQRILESARKKLADALLSGKAIKIAGGNFEVSTQKITCINGHEREIPLSMVGTEYAAICPVCSPGLKDNYFGPQFNRGFGKRRHGI